MNQTRLGSFVEAVINTAIGLVISVTANQIVFPMYGFTPTVAENVSISLIYTFISITRQYVIRRWFNARLRAAAVRITKAIS